MFYFSITGSAFYIMHFLLNGIKTLITAPFIRLANVTFGVLWDPDSAYNPINLLYWDEALTSPKST